MNPRRPQYDPHAADTGVHLGDDPCLFVGSAAHHEDDDVLGFVPCGGHAFEEGELQLVEFAFEERLQGGV